MIRIPLSGCRNFWDLGGYTVDDHHVIRPGMIFRSGRLSGLTDEDLEKFSALNIRTVVDLRSPDEIQEHPDRLPEKYPPRLLHVEMSHNGLGREEVEAVLRLAESGELDTHQHMIEAYREFPAASADQLRQVIDLLQDKTVYPVLFHCTAGKDRTGFVSAMVLGALGCPEHVIRSDYLLYDQGELAYRAQRYAGTYHERGILVTPEQTYPYLTAHSDYIHALMESIVSKWGDIPSYITRMTGSSEAYLQKIREYMVVESMAVRTG